MARARTLRITSWICHPATFLAAVAAIYAVSISIAGMLPRFRDADLVASAVTCDLVLVIPALYYLLLVRGRGWHGIGVVPVFLISLVAAARIVPADHQRLLAGFEWLAIPLELIVVGWIGRRAVASLRRARATGGGDAFEAIRHAASDVLGSARLGEILAQEIATLYFALGTWKTPLPRADGFTSYRENSHGLVMSAIGIVLVIETVAVHIAVHMLWSATAAFVLTALGLYGLLWMIGDSRALRLRVTTIEPDRIDVRLGIRWEVTIPRYALIGAEELTSPPSRDEGFAERPLKLVLIGAPNVELRLSRPVTARGMFGLRRSSTRVLLQIDDAPRFVARIRPWCADGDFAAETPRRQSACRDQSE